MFAPSAWQLPAALPQPGRAAARPGRGRAGRVAGGRPDRSRPVSAVSSASVGVRFYRDPPLYEKSKYRLVGKKLTQARRLVQKRVVREVREQQRKRHFQRVVCAVVVAAMLFMALVPPGAGLVA